MTTFSPTQIAAKPGWATDAKTLRVFLRAEAKANGTETPGKGSKWAIEGRELNAMRGRFNRWIAAQEEAKAKRAEAVKADAAADEAEEAADALEPTDEEIAALADDEG